MNTHLLDLLSLQWKVEIYTAPDSSLQVKATKSVSDGVQIRATACMSPAEATETNLQNFFWKKFFRLCMFKASYYNRNYFQTRR